MENQNQQEDPTAVQLEPQPPVPRSHKVLAYVLSGFFALALIAGIYYWQTTSNIPAVVDLPVHKEDNLIAGWKSYSNSEFQFNYPRNLTLSEKNGVVTLVHTIPYRNNGDCDMVGDETVYENLVDFKISLEVLSKKITPAYIDGKTKLGVLDGEYAYQGAEGCGIIEYYFPAGSGTLLIKKDAVQALSGISSLWNKEEILKVPGVISPEESKILFDQILSTFKFTEAIGDDTSTWKTYTDSKLNIEVMYPATWSINMNSNVLTIKGSDNCYTTLTFGGAVNPQWYKKNDYSEIKEGEKCDQTLSLILSSFKFTK